MSTQLATQQIRQSEWMEIIRSRSESGLSIKDFCRRHEISESAYYYWLRRIRAAALMNHQSSFVEISAPAESIPETAGSEEVVIELGGAKIRVNSSGCRKGEE